MSIKIKYELSTYSRNQEQNNPIEIKIDIKNFISSNAYWLTFESLKESIKEHQLIILDDVIEYFHEKKHKEYKKLTKGKKLVLQIPFLLDEQVAPIFLKLHPPQDKYTQYLEKKIEFMEKELAEFKQFRFQSIEKNKSNLDILFLIGMPKDQDYHVSCEKEIRKVIQVYAKRNISVTYEIARTKQRMKEMLSYNPKILHVICHGKKYEHSKAGSSEKVLSDRYYLEIEDHQNERSQLYGQELIEIIMNSNSFPKLIILNSCYSEEIYEDMKRYHWESDTHTLMVSRFFEIDNYVAFKFIQQLYENMIVNKEINNEILAQIKQKINLNQIQTSNKIKSNCLCHSKDRTIKDPTCECFIEVKSLSYEAIMKRISAYVKDMEDQKIYMISLFTMIKKEEYEYLKGHIYLHNQNCKITIDGYEKKRDPQKNWDLFFCSSFIQEYEKNRQKIKFFNSFLKDYNQLNTTKSSNETITFFIFTILYKKYFLDAERYIMIGNINTPQKNLQISFLEQSGPTTKGLDFSISSCPKIQMGSVMKDAFSFEDKLDNSFLHMKLKPFQKNYPLLKTKAIALKYLQNNIMKMNRYNPNILIFNMSFISNAKMFEKIYQIDLEMLIEYFKAQQKQQIFYMYSWNEDNCGIDFLNELNLQNIEILFQIEPATDDKEIKLDDLIDLKRFYEKLLALKKKDNEKQDIFDIFKKYGKSEKRIKKINRRLLYLVSELPQQEQLPLQKYVQKLLLQNIKNEKRIIYKRSLQRVLLRTVVASLPLQNYESKLLEQDNTVDNLDIQDIQTIFYHFGVEDQQLFKYPQVISQSSLHPFILYTVDTHQLAPIKNNFFSQYKYKITSNEIARALILNQKVPLLPLITKVYLLHIKYDKTNYKQSYKTFNDIIKIHKKFLSFDDKNPNQSIEQILISLKIDFYNLFDEENSQHLNLFKLSFFSSKQNSRNKNSTLIKTFNLSQEFTNDKVGGVYNIVPFMLDCKTLNHFIAKPNQDQEMSIKNQFDKLKKVLNRIFYDIQCKKSKTEEQNSNPNPLILSRSHSQKEQQIQNGVNECLKLLSYINIAQILIKYNVSIQRMYNQEIIKKNLLKKFIKKSRKAQYLNKYKLICQENEEELNRMKDICLQNYYGFEIDLEESNLFYNFDQDQYLGSKKIIEVCGLFDKNGQKDKEVLLNNLTNRLSCVLYFFNSNYANLKTSLERTSQIQTIVSKKSGRVIFKTNLLTEYNIKQRLTKIEGIKKVIILDENEILQNEYENDEDSMRFQQSYQQIPLGDYLKSINAIQYENEVVTNKRQKSYTPKYASSHIQKQNSVNTPKQNKLYEEKDMNQSKTQNNLNSVDEDLKVELLIILNKSKINIKRSSLCENRVIWFDISKSESFDQFENGELAIFQKEFIDFLLQFLLTRNTISSKSNRKYHEQREQNEQQINFSYAISQSIKNILKKNESLSNLQKVKLFIGLIRFDSYIQILTMSALCEFNCQGFVQQRLEKITDEDLQAVLDEKLDQSTTTNSSIISNILGKKQSIYFGNDCNQQQTLEFTQTMNSNDSQADYNNQTEMNLGYNYVESQQLKPTSSIHNYQNGQDKYDDEHRISREQSYTEKISQLSKHYDE